MKIPVGIVTDYRRVLMRQKSLTITRGPAGTVEKSATISNRGVFDVDRIPSGFLQLYGGLYVLSTRISCIIVAPLGKDPISKNEGFYRNTDLDTTNNG